MNKLQKDLQKYWNVKTGLLLLIFLLIALTWFKYIAGLVLVMIFAPLSFVTVRYSKMVPHISIESFTSTSLLFGYLFGGSFGFMFGFIVGSFSYIMNSFVSATYLSNPILAGLAAVLVAFLKSTGMSFQHAFFIAICARTVVAWFWFGMLGIDPIERVTHQVSQFFSNLVIYLPLWVYIISLVDPFI